MDAGPQGSNEDDLTVKLSEILTVNSIIRNALLGGKASVASSTLTLTLTLTLTPTLTLTLTLALTLTR